MLQTNKSDNGQIIRWRMILQDYDYEVIHQKGKIHQSADVLPRIGNNINTSN